MAFELNNKILKKYGNYYIYRNINNFNIISVGLNDKIYLKGNFSILGIFKEDYNMWIWADSFPIIDIRDIKLTKTFRETNISDKKYNENMKIFINNSFFESDLETISNFLDIIFENNKKKYVGIFIDQKKKGEYIYYLMININYYNI